MASGIPPIHSKDISPIKEDWETAVNTVVDRFAADSGFQGIVGIRRGSSIYTKSIGYSTTSGIPHSPDTPFPICSISKTFTATAILKLVEQNKLSLDDKVEKFITHDPKGIFKDITIRELLMHTSGIPDLDPEKISFSEEADFAKIYASIDTDQDRPPRGVVGYNNFAYVVLSEIIEKAAGCSYEDALKELIFGPAELKHASAPENLQEMPQNVQGLFNDSALGVMPQDHPSVRKGAGNIYCSMNDLIQFEKTLKGGKLLSPPSQQILYSQHMGWDLPPYESDFHSRGIEVRAKAGAMGDPRGEKPIISAVLLSVPQKDLSIVVLSNKELSGESNWAPDLGETILGMLLP